MMNMLFESPDGYEARVALWHEAGHAVVAMHMGAKVLYYGLDPLPHCLVWPWGLSEHQRGVLLCAGGAVTRAVFGHEWGTETDYRMAATLGDLEVLREEAFELVTSLMSEARYLVEARMGGPGKMTAKSQSKGDWFYTHRAQDIEELSADHPRYAEIVKVAEKAKMGNFMKYLIAKGAAAQMKHPHLAARLSGFGDRHVRSDKRNTNPIGR